MSERTLEDALAHAEWARESWGTTAERDLVLLADEVKRLEAELDAYKDLAS